MKNAIGGADKEIAPAAQTSLEKLKSDYDIMLDFAVKRGITLPKQLILDNSNLSNDELVANYNDLTRVILPTSVESISYIRNILFRNKAIKKWHEIPIYRRSLLISMAALLSVIAISLSPEVNTDSLSKGILNSSGITLFVNLLFICSSSLLGVMFYTIKSMNDRIKSYTLTHVDILTFNSAILIGVISGFLTSEVFSAVVTSGLEGSKVVTKMTLAILGGFSSDAIFSMLQGFVNRVKTLFTSSTHLDF